MTIYSENVQSWHMPSVVKGLYVDTLGSSSASNISLYIPVLMPMIAFGTKKIQNKALQKSCFCNDSKCKPSVAASIKTQNYVTVPVYKNQEFRRNYFRRGAEFLVEAIDSDINNMRVTNREDNSVSLY